MSENSEVLTQTEIGTILHLALAEVERLHSDVECMNRIGEFDAKVKQSYRENIEGLTKERDTALQERDEARAAIPMNTTASSYLGELDLIAEALGVEGIAEIRNRIGTLITDRELAERRAVIAEERAKVAEASNAALFQAAWLMLGAPVTPGHRHHASTTYWGRREIFAALIEGMRVSGEYPGRQLLLELEQANERAEVAVRMSSALRQLRDCVQALFAEFPWIATSDAGAKLYTEFKGTPPPTIKRQKRAEEQSS